MKAKGKGRSLKVWVFLFLCLAIGLPIAWILFLKLEGTPPVLTLGPGAATIGPQKDLSLSIADENSGVRRIWVGLAKGDKEVVLLEKQFPGGTLTKGGEVRKTDFDIPVVPEKLGLSDGKATLSVMVWDYSWRRWWHGNKTARELTVIIDTKPPEIEVITRVHNVSQGGAGLVVYKLSEHCPKSGVAVGDNFFPGHAGHFDDEHTFMAFFALNYNQGKGTQIAIEAHDQAGNSANAGFPHHIRRKVFKKDIISISNGFLNRKMPEFAAALPEGTGSAPVDQFLAVNRVLRKANYQTITGICADSEADLYWQGRFSRLPNAANRAGFADHRDYKYQGEKIDHQVHLGVDLASVAHSPVPAANSGKVAFTGVVGIYGKSVLIDHGFGLFSMYAHLSGIDVEAGQMVEKNAIIGRTGATGLAGGDHLHFSMLVHNTFVNPIEWWDASWIRNNITQKIDTATAGAG